LAELSVSYIQVNYLTGGLTLIGRELDEIMCLDPHDILDKVASGLSMILNDQISGVLSTKNQNVADL
jgi:hypothetical protein